jgi:RecA-family ATPase
MGYPLVPDEKGIKIIAQEMEPEKMYYCYHNNKVMLVYKDEQEFLNCYEIEEEDIVSIVKQCKNPDEIEKAIQDYLAKNNLSIK